ncbi:MAG TPA: histidine phosphatase family protein [Spongiibacteraceae bacterium]|jgi:phosphohistidine phosphatase|nr:histidine phosphatase family protein [Spongiibacteraceae bacterium]HUH37979.1 histidine phosphatase family protein [Spongiibacteraceae bacterium]
MQLIIMRHGQARALTGAHADADRALTDEGRRQACAAARWLKTSGYQPLSLWVSPYRRAQQTADEVAAVIGGLARREQANITPNDAPGAFLSELDAAGDGVMLVSHNPFVSALIGLLVEGDASRGPVMGTASIAVLSGEFWAPGCCRLEALWHEHEHRDGQ